MTSPVFWPEPSLTYLSIILLILSLTVSAGSHFERQPGLSYGQGALPSSASVVRHALDTVAGLLAHNLHIYELLRSSRMSCNRTAVSTSQ
jgi:hypothetical protein